MDLVCVDDLDEYASETDDELEGLAQDLYHRLLEDFGSNPDDEARGVGLLSRLSGHDEPTMIARLIESDFLLDDRVISCVAIVKFAGESNSGAFATVDIVVATAAGGLRLAYAANLNGTLTGGVVA
jgi:hypothetical protein